jgi:hypothetical protein
MTQKEQLKRIEERHAQTMTIQEVLDLIQKRIDEANEELDGGEYAYGRMQALEDLHHELFWDGVDLS